MASASTIQDDFQWGSVDTIKWDTSLSADSTQVTEPNLYLSITHTASIQYNTMVAATTYDLTGSNFYVNVTSVGNQALASHEVIMLAYLDTSNQVWFTCSGGNLAAFKKVATVGTQIGASIAYSSTTHAWWRIRESGGTTFFDTAPDGSNWTNRWSVANPFAVTAIKPGLQSGCYANEVSSSGGQFTNFNLQPGALQFTWSGYTWNTRVQQGPSMYNNQFSTSNVSGPDGNGYMTVSTSNPGSSPSGGEFFSVTRGWGYGTYTWCIATEVDNLNSNVVVGGMFTFDFTRPPDYAEIDMGEARYYNGLGNAQILFSHVWNNSGVGTFIIDNINVSADAVRTYQCVWSPTRLIYASYAGQGVGTTPLTHIIHEDHIPKTALERVHFNIWVQNLSTPASTPATSVVIRQFTFDPLREAPGNTGRHLTLNSGMSRSEMAN